MASFSDLPVELHQLILSYIVDSFSLHRIERVCVLWNQIVADRERKGFKFRRKKVSGATHALCWKVCNDFCYRRLFFRLSGG